MEDMFKYTWMALIAAIGGTLGFISKISPKLKGETITAKLREYILGLVTSMFVAFIVYEISVHFMNSERLSVAVAGLAAFAGTDLLVVLQEKLFDVVKNKMGGNRL